MSGQASFNSNRRALPPQRGVVTGGSHRLPVTNLTSSMFAGFSGCFKIERIEDDTGPLFLCEPLQFVPIKPAARHTYQIWSPDQDAFLINARVHNQPFSWIGKQMGRTRNSCIGRYGRLVKMDHTPEQPHLSTDYNTVK